MRRGILTVVLLNLTGLLPRADGYAKVSRVGVSSAPRYLEQSPGSLQGKLKNGEAVDHPSTPKYSTLDQEMLAKINGRFGKTNPQDRFIPQAPFEHSVAQSNGNKIKAEASSSGNNQNVGSYATIPKDAYANGFQYPAGDSKPTKDTFLTFTTAKYPPDSQSYFPQEVGSQNSFGESNVPSYLEKYPSKSPEYFHQAGYIEDHDSYLSAHEHDYSPELIYDHPPSDDYHYQPHHFQHHHHHHDLKTTTTTERPNDQRLVKRPYSYYYIAALILKSIARHKINFPSNLADAVHSRAFHLPWWELTQKVVDAIDQFTAQNSNKLSSH